MKLRAKVRIFLGDCTAKIKLPLPFLDDHKRRVGWVEDVRFDPASGWTVGTVVLDHGERWPASWERKGRML